MWASQTHRYEGFRHLSLKKDLPWFDEMVSSFTPTFLVVVDKNGIHGRYSREDYNSVLQKAEIYSS